MDTAKLFQTGRSQAVRLPKAYRFEGDEVYVKKTGQGVMLLPVPQTLEQRRAFWKKWLEELPAWEGTLEREQPEEQQERDWDGLWE